MRGRRTIVRVSVAVVVLLLVVVVLVLLLRQYRCRVRALEATLVRLRAATGLAEVGADGVTPLISVEILNGPELAARESWAARWFGSLAPHYVGREVAARAAAQMAEQLTREGVRAEVRIGVPAPVEVGEPGPAGETVVAGVHDARSRSRALKIRR